MITPLEHYPELAKKIGLLDLYFKREDLHPYGSHKGRSIPFMVDHYYENGERRFAISSSGNAALAAALHVNALNGKNDPPDAGNTGGAIELDIYVGNNIAPHKLERLTTAAAKDGKHIRIMKKERPLQALTEAAKEGARSLRQSTDDTALEGYRSLAEELAMVKDAPAEKRIAAVFVGTSSGTTAQALAECFAQGKLPIQIHIVQTSSCHPISECFESYDGPEEKSIADAIVDKTAARKAKVAASVEKTGGTGWFATNEDIIAAQGLVAKHAGLQISTNSALSVVGAMKAAYRGYEIKGATVCMIGGE